MDNHNLLRQNSTHLIKSSKKLLLLLPNYSAYLSSKACTKGVGDKGSPTQLNRLGNCKHCGISFIPGWTCKCRVYHLSPDGKTKGRVVYSCRMCDRITTWRFDNSAGAPFSRSESPFSSAIGSPTETNSTCSFVSTSKPTMEDRQRQVSLLAAFQRLKRQGSERITLEDVMQK